MATTHLHIELYNALAPELLSILTEDCTPYGNFGDAVTEAFEEHTPVRRASWPEDTYIEVQNKVLMVCDGAGSEPYAPTLSDLAAEDWCAATEGEEDVALCSDFDDAIEALNDGEAIRRATWPKGVYVEMRNGRSIVANRTNGRTDPYTPNFEDTTAKDWHLVEDEDEVNEWNCWDNDHDTPEAELNWAAINPVTFFDVAQALHSDSKRQAHRPSWLKGEHLFRRDGEHTILFCDIVRGVSFFQPTTEDVLASDWVVT